MTGGSTLLASRELGTFAPLPTAAANGNLHSPGGYFTTSLKAGTCFFFCVKLLTGLLGFLRRGFLRALLTSRRQPTPPEIPPGAPPSEDVIGRALRGTWLGSDLFGLNYFLLNTANHGSKSARRTLRPWHLEVWNLRRLIKPGGHLESDGRIRQQDPKVL